MWKSIIFRNDTVCNISWMNFTLYLIYIVSLYSSPQGKIFLSQGKSFATLPGRMNSRTSLSSRHIDNSLNVYNQGITINQNFLETLMQICRGASILYFNTPFFCCLLFSDYISIPRLELIKW